MTCVESKYTRIIKSKKMILITRRLQEVYNDLWDSHKSASILSKNYMALRLTKFTYKS